MTVIALVRKLNALMVDDLVARLRADGYRDVTAAHHVVFENIDAVGTRLTVLAQRAGLTRQSVTELVAALERNGYLEVVPDSSDGRARLAVLTEKGRTVVRAALRHIDDIESDWQAALQRAGLKTSLHGLLQSAIAERVGAAADANRGKGGVDATTTLDGQRQPSHRGGARGDLRTRL